MHFSTKDILQPFHTTWLPGNIQAAMLRLDTIHPLVQGNKWFKLKYNLEAAGNTRIVTFGGAYSNHIVATAAACRLYGLTSVGIIRGEKPASPGHTLQKAAELGMELHYVSRELYSQLKSGGEMMQLMQHLLDQAYVIPEGGHNAEGARGCEDILKLADTSAFTHILCAVGTGTTLAGLVNAGTGQHITGISALKGAFSLEQEVENLLKAPSSQWRLLHDFHEGGYAKHSPELISFMNDFYRETGIPTDKVYTGKMALAFRRLAEQSYFPAGSRVLLIHSGGLQGNESLAPGVLCF
ncbi:1-aminocyclopropane-1-carboxylate deaminase/D-cysteine desulfhydrase [Chitinophaga sp. GCM10012297]|uniref:Pyridoxal-phosphate dependent enzyme n=1 Tax=Chitinophaga chungangae TaxID=2821488 RepID=A0ABS3Y8V0_9BACT|nr:pyridoxal-phosphate dependent enzyme [Chitinophaga chungangae]MBO9151099.1 pyridoxal-phosphate dependent enzyme [Chitinophaga chungangae]